MRTKGFRSFLIVLALLLSFSVSAFALSSYRDPLTSMYILFPLNWEQEEESYAVDPWQALFMSTETNEEFFISVSDFWESIPESEKKGLTRLDLNNDTFSDSDIETMFSSTGYDLKPKKEMIGGKEYFVTGFDTTYKVLGIDVPVTIQMAIRVENGYMYMFRSNLYDKEKKSEFNTILSGITYRPFMKPSSAASNSSSSPASSSSSSSSVPTSSSPTSTYQKPSLFERAMTKYIAAAIVIIIGTLVSSFGKKKKSSAGTDMAPDMTATSDGKKFICRHCGYRSTGWYQTCPHCGVAGKMEKLKPEELKAASESVAASANESSDTSALDQFPICPACGRRQESAGKYCIFCGASLNSADSRETAESTPASEEPAVVPVESSSGLDLDLDLSHLPPTLRRAFIFIEDESWDRAEEYLEKVLDEEPENPYAYLGKAMVNIRLNSLENISQEEVSNLVENRYFRRACRYAEGELADKLKELKQ